MYTATLVSEVCTTRMQHLSAVSRCLVKRSSGYSCRKLCIANSQLALGDEPVLVVGSNPGLLQRLASQVEVRAGFITEEEEAALLKELEPGLKRKRYEFDHWDNAIHGYKETERATWGPSCAEVLNRVRSVAFPPGSPLLGPVHVLDLDQKGYIKPHIDSVKFCGSTIAGLNLLSASVMRLVEQDSPAERLDLLLPRYSIYIMRDEARYKFTHEILKDEESFFNGQRVPRQRRISIICRNLPS
ncbi:alpha-ketoglutarate-dependent dioxygenase alkB homolog 7, mitochondrial [Eucyclogobius newberryi]|uniref:alpha-ketoglutarate-dependent dioxygenase alkB homolog 7, mitochondrial n=1 Tax=Eucyclogobius newberryi TaxID=166745 RepID=UPI003B5BB7A8